MSRNVDNEYLGKLQDYFAKNRALPSMSRIAGLLNFSSTGGVFELVGRLKKAGYLTQGPDRRLTPTEKFFERTVLGQIRAGQPESVEEVAGGVNIDARLVRLPTRTSLLNVRGDSMASAGILDGDSVTVERGAPAKPGDIVVAIVDNDYTIKFLDIDPSGQFFLRPANPAYANIYPKNSLEIFGLVIGSFRVYAK
jgi:repressor LexA